LAEDLRSVIGVAVVVVFMILAASRPWEALFPAKPEEPEAGCHVLPLPENGAVWVYSGAPRTSPLTLSTGAGANYFVKFEDETSHAPIIAFFIYGKSTIEADVPVGTYVMKYAIGKDWCGINDLFGPDTYANRAPKALTFTIDSGHTIELARRRGGNLPVDEIKRHDF